MTDDPVVLSMFSVILILLGLIYRQSLYRLKRLEVNFYNFTRSIFVLMSKLHPAQATEITTTMADFYLGMKRNGADTQPGA